jgi:hypothetical protein
MAETTQGTTGYLHGIAATSPTAAVFQNLRKQVSDALETEIKDENGKVITLRTDDERGDLSATMRIKAAGFTRVAIGAKFTLVGGAFAGDYIVKSTSEAHVNDGWAEYEISAVAYEYITPA